MFLRAVPLTVVVLLTALPLYAKSLSVSGDNVNLRSGPGVRYEIKYAYGNGFPLRQLERKGEWIKVRDFEKDTGWIHATFISDQQYVIVSAHKNSDKKVNIRNGPSTRHDIVAKSYYGVVFKKIKSKSGWAQVQHETGLEGWIKETLLWQ